MRLLVSREHKNDDTVVKIGNVSIGDGSLCMIAGPCTIESFDQLHYVASGLSKLNIDILRAGAFKPRTSSYSFQGMGSKGLDILSNVKSEFGIPTVSEIIDIADLSLFDDVDILQVGAKNMQNYSLLKKLGRQEKPVLLKRGWANTIDEFLESAEYIYREGNHNIILCERGIRTFEPSARNSFDINAIPILKSRTHLPVIGDPSHGTGISELVMPVSLAIVAAGADGLMIEIHENPECALCDGKQAITLDEYEILENRVKIYEKIRNFDNSSL